MIKMTAQIKRVFRIDGVPGLLFRNTYTFVPLSPSAVLTSSGRIEA